LFICVAVVVDEPALHITDAAMRQISRDFCGGAEISSGRIAGKNELRLKYIEAIRELPFGFYALVINKDRIPKDSGLRFKRTFYKYINQMLYESLVRSGKNLRVFADQIGGQDFMDSFKPYLEGRGRPNLFQDFQHAFVKSHETPLIQLADLIAGTLSYCFDPQKQNDHSTRFRDLLRCREIGIQCWPWDLAPQTTPAAADTTLDDLIRSTMTRRVVMFLEEHEHSANIDRQMQFATLSHLFFARQFEERGRQALVSDELMRRLKDIGLEVPSKQHFLSKIVGAIRFEGIILAGSPDGYRLALSVADINDYLNHDSNIIGPMLARMKTARESVSTDTAQRYDILGPDAYAGLKALAEAFQDSLIEQATVREDEASDDEYE